MANGREIFAYQGDVAWFLEDGKYGLINRERVVLLEPVLLHVEPFDANGFAIVEVPGETSLEKLGIVDKAGQWFLEPKYYKISRHGDEGEYFFIYPFYYEGEKHTIINTKGEEVFPSEKYYLFRVTSIHEGIIMEDDEERIEYINFDGEKLFEKIDWNANREPGNEVEGEDWEWYKGTDFHEGLAAIWVNNSCWYYINTKGEAVISKACYVDGQYNWLDEMYADLPSDFKDGMALIKTKYGEWMFINAQEELAVPGIWEGAKGFGEFDLAPVKKDGLWGFINKQGEMVLPKIWEGAREFGEFGLAPAKKNGL